MQEIAQELSISRTTVRKYLKHPEAVIPKPRPPRPSKLDPYKEQIEKWVMEDHCTNCEVIFERLQKLGYTGGISILKEQVHPLRPAVAGHAPVQRYETKPGEQIQFDWGEFVYEHEGKLHKFYGFVAILGYSRMRFVTFVKRCDTPTLIRCLMEAFEYFGGLTRVALTDRMKSVLLEMVENKPRWNPRFADFMVSIAVAARVCKPYTPQTKGKVERTVSHVKKSLWGGITFTDLDDLNRQAYAWCERINSRVHRTTHARPVDRLAEERLLPLPQDFAWERFATEERKVTWDGYVSYDGVLYGLPGTLQLAGKQVQVRERKGLLTVWSAGTQVFAIEKRPRTPRERTACRAMEDRRLCLGCPPCAHAHRPFAGCSARRKPSLTGVRSVLWHHTRARGGRMKKGTYKHLNLTHLEAALPHILEAAQREQWTYETLLERALAAEVDGREQKAIARRLKAARIPGKKTLDGFDFTFQPMLSERRLRELADLSFVRTCTNVVFLGPPGTGKTHLSLALADRALTVGHSVLFTTLSELAQALESASHPGLMRQRLRRYIAPNLLVIDEVGYTKLSQEQAHHFFELVTSRYEHGSIILTSNTSFAQWGTLLGDEVLATALLDRLLHHAEVIPINGRSYRMKERQTSLSEPPEAALSATGGQATGV